MSLLLASISGSTAFTAAVSETVTLSEALSVAYAANTAPSETVALSEALSVAYAANTGPAETVTLSESLVVLLAATPALVETVTLSEVLAASRGTAAGLSETVTLSEASAVAYAANVAPSETVTLSEALASQYSVTLGIAETVTVSEALAAAYAAVTALSETVPFNEALAASRGTEAATAETVTLSDSLASAYAAITALAETVTLSEALASSLATTAAAAETVTLSDSLAVLRGATAAPAETVTLSESLVVLYAAAAGLSETVTLSDSLSSSAETSASTAETVTLSDSVSSVKAATPSVSETVTLSEALSVVFENTVNATESVALSEALGTTFTTAQDLPETTAISDSLAASRGQPAAVSEAVGVSEVLASAYEANSALPETVALSDSLSGAVASAVSPAETITLSDSVLVLRAAPADVAETIVLSDSLAASYGQATAVSETVALSEVTSAQYAATVVAVETVALNDSGSASAATTAGLSETVTLSEALAFAFSANVGLAESVGLSEALTGSTSASVELSETVALSEAANASRSSTADLTETVALSETVVGLRTTTISVSETVTLSEAFDSLFVGSSTLLETVSISEVLVGSYGTAASASESLTLAELVGCTGSATVPLAEAATLSEASSSYFAGTQPLSETVTVVEGAAASVAGLSGLAEAISVSEALQHARVSSVGLIEDPFILGDSVAVGKSGSAFLSEAVPWYEVVLGRFFSPQGTPMFTKNLVGVLDDGTAYAASVSTNQRTALSVPLGADWAINMTVSEPGGNLVNMTGGSLLLTIKKRFSDSQVLVARLATISSVRGAFRFLPSDTKNLTPGQYCYDVWFTDSSGVRTSVLLTSPFTLEAAVALVGTAGNTPFYPAPTPTVASGWLSITDVAVTGGIVSAKIYEDSPNNTILQSATISGLSVSISVKSSAPRVIVGGAPAVLPPHVSGGFYSGDVAVSLSSGGTVFAQLMTPDGDLGASDTVTLTHTAPPAILTAAFSATYPGSQTELKAGDVITIEGTTNIAATGIQVTDAGACALQNFTYASSTSFSISVVIADRGTTLQALTASLRAHNAVGAYGAVVATTNSAQVNNLYPTATWGAKTYPATQSALKGSETATVAITLANYNTIVFDSPNADLSVTAPTVGGSPKTVTRIAGTYNVSTNNLRVTATRSANAAVTVGQTIVAIANVAPTVDVTLPAARLRSGGNNGTAVQSHTITLTSSQQLSAAPTLNAGASGTFTGSWSGGPTAYTRTMQVADADTKGTYSFAGLVATGLSGLVQNTLNSGGTYELGGFVARDLTFSAFSQLTALGVAVVTYSKLTAATFTATGNAALRNAVQGNTSNVVDTFTVVALATNPTSIYWNDASAASTNSSGTAQITQVQETV